MNPSKLPKFLQALLLISLLSCNVWGVAPKAESLDDYHARMNWFAQAQYGMFIHFGLYSQLGGEWKGGNLLLNVGPDGNGQVQPEAISVLKEVGEMLRARPIQKHVPTITQLPGW